MTRPSSLLPLLLCTLAACAGDLATLDAAVPPPADLLLLETGAAEAGSADRGAGTADRGAVDLASPSPDQPLSSVVPPLGGASGGSGGTAAPTGKPMSAGGVSYLLIVPTTYSPAKPNRLMIVFSGTEGASQMASNLKSLAVISKLSDVIFAVLDGPATFGNGQAGATVLDDVRKLYNIDNDRTFLLSESAGTSAGLKLGLSLRQSYFAAYWANDVTTSATPAQTAAALGFAPWGNAGPGGQLQAATAIVTGMKTAGYRLPTPAPYNGPGSTIHGSPQQFMAALAFYDGKSRK